MKKSILKIRLSNVKILKIKVNKIYNINIDI